MLASLRSRVLPWRGAVPLLAASLGAAGLSMGCGGGTPEPIAFQNRTFYQYESGMSAAALQAYEEHYPPLDLGPKDPNPEYRGVTVLSSAVHLSRPTNWIIRAASNTPEQRYIEYVSPNEYIFSIYELVESPDELWRDVMQRYEDDAKAHGAEILGQRIPVATWNAQGRAYVVKRRVKAAKGPFANMSREILARSDHRIVLVQIVHQGENLAPLSEELLRVIQTLEVL